MTPDRLQSLTVVLVETSHPGNIGAAARAMKTMGLQRLVLVNPKQFPHPDATAFASGATDILTEATVVADLNDALVSMRWVVGVSARLRDVAQPLETPKSFACAWAASPPLPTALVFGNEQSGLSNSALAQCHQQIRIPTSPVYGSLNLAQAVQIVCYELAQSVGYGAVPSTLHHPANQQAFEGMFAHWCEVLEAAHYLHPQQRQKMLLRMRRLLLRAAPSAVEVTLFRGACRNILRKIQNNDEVK